MNYRVYDTIQKKYVTDHGYWIVKPNGTLAENDYGDEIGHPECVLEWGTGIIDSTGQEIFEGDIIIVGNNTTSKIIGNIHDQDKPKKMDMSSNCGLEYFNKWNQMSKGEITCEEFNEWFNANCLKCKYMSEICMYGEA